MNLSQLSTVIAARPDRSVRYKVWVQIERVVVDGDDEIFDDVGLPDPLGIFSTLREAQDHVRSLSGWYPEGSDNRD